jgi:amidophosphoribosyltransferase
MAKLDDLVAFKAAVELLIEMGKEIIIKNTYDEAIEELKKPVSEMKNVVKNIYESFTPEEISARISKMLKSNEIKAEIEIVFQSIEGLHQACPDNLGDWYFTGNYPTPGGNKVANRSYIDFIGDRYTKGVLIFS